MTFCLRERPGAARWVPVLLLVAFGSAGLVTPAGAVARPAAAVPASSVDQEVLTFAELLPGQTDRRYLTLSVDVPSAGHVVRAEVVGTAGLPAYVLAGLRSCEVAWQAGVCGSGEQALLPFAAVPASQALTVPVHARHTLYLEVAVGVSDDVPQGTSGQLTFVVTLEGDGLTLPSPTPSPSSGGGPSDPRPPGQTQRPPLPVTGAESLAMLAAGLSLIGLGSAVRTYARRRRAAA